MTVLSADRIRALCQANPPLVVDWDEEHIRSASYDLRLGDQYYLSGADDGRGGALEIGHLQERRRLLEVPANRVLIVGTLERVNIPKDLVAHLSLKLDVLLDGLIMASQSQVDAGYRGGIFALLYNLSDRPVTLQQNQSLLRIEFVELSEATSKPYAGDYQDVVELEEVVSERITSSLHEMEARLVRGEERINQVRRVGLRTIWGGVIAVVAVLAAVWGPIQFEASDAKASADQAEEVVTEVRGLVESRDSELRSEIEQLRRELARISATSTSTVEP